MGPPRLSEPEWQPTAQPPRPSPGPYFLASFTGRDRIECRISYRIQQRSTMYRKVAKHLPKQIREANNGVVKFIHNAAHCSDDPQWLRAHRRRLTHGERRTIFWEKNGNRNTCLPAHCSWCSLAPDNPKHCLQSLLSGNIQGSRRLVSIEPEGRFHKTWPPQLKI